MDVPYLKSLAEGAAGAVIASAFVRALPEPAQPAKGFWQNAYLWFYNFLHGLLANFDKLRGGGLNPIATANAQADKAVADMVAKDTTRGIDVNRMGPVLLVLILFASAPMLPAQSAGPFKDVIAGGAAWNPQGSPQINGMLVYAKKANESGLYSFSLVDITPVYDPNSTRIIKISTLTTNITSGLAQYVRTIGPARIYALGTLGIGSGGGSTGFAYSGGGAAVITLGKKGWLLMPNIRVLKNNQSGFQGIYGLAVGWGQ